LSALLDAQPASADKQNVQNGAVVSAAATRAKRRWPKRQSGSCVEMRYKQQVKRNWNVLLIPVGQTVTVSNC
jgi:hypothetical protein